MRWMKKLAPRLRYAFSNFGPLIAFYAVNHFWGLKPAILASIASVIIEVAHKLGLG